ncbi:hypothetical protein Phep_0729 [Sporocytophaga myxococcoides]|uniref:Lipoprotein n=1 Tax=Sporocytophaga myxococcoides TaxID=153721 RepID=A0A098LCQ0_9BACT|nr:hypothetical protein [Sporocytophaga myxococcoides]GAL83928.1 hypothetical protein Phep_0729 [Sporocytophaga myxococcoides]
MLRFFILVLLSLTTLSCSDRKNDAGTIRSFYYWKSIFSLNGKEKEAINTLGIKKIYLRFFDVDWTDKPEPKGHVILKDSIPGSLQIVPVVYLTNRTLSHIQPHTLEILADNITTSVKVFAKRNNVNFTELQIDCDWSDKTRDKYFNLLRLIKSKLPLSCILSATIRLHQVKYRNITGVPPADRGMLMFYNMGQLKPSASRNSIWNKKDAESYVAYTRKYPLPLDSTLPIFEWALQIRDGKIIDLLSKETLPDFTISDNFRMNKDKILAAEKSFYYQNKYIKEGDVFRMERVSGEDLEAAAKMLSHHLSTTPASVSLFDLDSKNFTDHDIEQLEEIFNYFN